MPDELKGFSEVLHHRDRRRSDGRFGDCAVDIFTPGAITKQLMDDYTAECESAKGKQAAAA